MIKTVKLAGYELRRLKGPAPIIGLIFLVLIPTICGAMYLWSNWDPYGRMDRVPVAVVNQDIAVEVEGQSVNAGARLVAELRADTIFDWQFVDEQQAADGLADGAYYMIITIPPDFSANLISGSGPDPERAVISLRRDDANGYLFDLMADSVQDELESAIDRAAIGAYLDSVFANLGTIKTEVTQAATDATALAAGSATTLTTASDLSTGISTSVQDSAEVTSGLALAKEQSTQLVTGITQAQTASASLVTAITPLESTASQVASDADSVASGNAQLASSLTPAIGAVTSAVPPLGQATVNTEAATSDMASLVSGQLNPDVAAMATAVAAVASGPLDPDKVSNLQEALATLQATSAQLTGQSATASQSASSASSAFNTLDSAASDLSGSGSDLTFLATTSAQVATGATDVSEGMSTASSNASNVDGTVASLAASATDLDTGIANLQITAQRLVDGLGTAETQSASVVTGVTDLDTGANLLAGDLTAIADRIPTLAPDEQANSEQVISSPANLEITVDNPATFYGRGLAPLFFGLAIWILAIAVFQVLRPITGRALAGRASSLRITIAGWLPVLGIAVLGSLLLLGVVWVGLGLDPVNVGGAFGVVLLAAACFTAIAYLLRTWLGGVGTAIMLILLMIQLTASGGLYPVQTTPAPFRAVHWFNPMTYLVDALRVVFTGGPTDHLWRDVGVLSGLTILAIGFSWLVVHRRRRFRVGDLHPVLV